MSTFFNFIMFCVVNLKSGAETKGIEPDLNLKNSNGNTPLALALSLGMKQVVSDLIKGNRIIFPISAYYTY